MFYAARSRRALVVVALGLIAAIGLTAWIGVFKVRGAAGGGAGEHRGENCPTGILPLPADGIARAVEAALQQAAAAYEGIDTSGVRADSVSRGNAAGIRGEQVRRGCGKRVQRRTAVVYLFFPAMKPSASLSQGVAFVSRFGDGYRIWEVAH